ncbi:MAG: MarR family transcriptional regulator [Streptococcaceae bacterium]|jgi:DNA-binding MarR family transcriptional regulator|nr:MarR family transcriptional regulator [Streptococcaceae bacterium]
MDYQQEAEKLLHVIKQAMKSPEINRINGFARGDMPVLGYLKKHEDKPTSPSEIGDYCNVSTARVATILGNLENKGFIRREIDRKDRRKIIVSLTAEGDQVFCQLKNKMILSLATRLEIMGEKDSQDLIRTFQKFIDTLEKEDVRAARSEA